MALLENGALVFRMIWILDKIRNQIATLCINNNFLYDFMVYFFYPHFHNSHCKLETHIWNSGNYSPLAGGILDGKCMYVCLNISNF